MRPMSLLTGLLLASPALFAQGTLPAGDPQARIPSAADSAVMRALDLRGEVILPSFTFIATQSMPTVS